VADEVTVLGLATRGEKDRLSVWLVEVHFEADGSIAVVELDPWQATSGADEGSQLVDVHDAIVNALDAPRLGPVEAVAVKRVEMPRGRPSGSYDRRLRFESAAMMAARRQGKRYFSYRRNQLGRGSHVSARARSADGAPTSTEALEALDASCAGLGDLGQPR
jgi:hypothetical protein